MAHDVFISYAPKDKPTADAVCRTLEGEGIRCWIAPRDIIPGMDWSHSILEAIERAQLTVLVFSAEANASEQVHREVAHRSMPMIVLRIEAAEPACPNCPSLWETRIRPSTAGGAMQWVDALTPPLESHLRRLADMVKRCLDEKVMPHPLVTVGNPPSPVEAEEPDVLEAASERNESVEAECFAAPAPLPPPPMPASSTRRPHLVAPSYSPHPASRTRSGLFRAMTGLFRRSEPSAAAASPSTASLASQKPLRDRVDFSVYAPHPVRPGASFLLNVWASLPGQRDQMVERAAALGRKFEVGSRGGILLPSATPLLLHLRLDGFDLDNPIEPFEWHGQVTNISFRVSARARLPSGNYPGEVHLLDGVMLIAKFYFEILVDAAQTVDAPAPASPAKLRCEWVRSAFASYASQDRARVVQRVQGISATGIDVFLDVASLRAGHDWQQQLFRAIEATDVFYLFWSGSAKASPHVEEEWRAALEKKGLSFIHPIPLEDPRHALPPTELTSLHFNDIYLAILKTTEKTTEPNAAATHDPQ